MVKKGYQQTEVGVVPKEWSVMNLRDIADFLGGGTPSKSIAEYWNGDIPWISSSDISLNSVHGLNITRYITGQAVKESSTQLCPRNAILIVTRVGVGKIAIAPTNICTSQDFTNIVLRQDNVEYVARALQPVFYCMSNETQGTSIKGVTTDEVKNTSIALPPIKEQEQIATVLSEIDELISLTEKQISKKKAIKQGAMQELLTGKCRLPGFAGEWKICRLDEIADFPTATISTDQFDNRFYVGTDNMIAYKGDVKYNELALIYPKVRQYQTEDIILSNIRPYLQKIWYATRNGGCSNDVLVIRKKDGHAVEPKFLYYQLSRDGFYDEIMANAVGTKMPRGDKAIVKSYRINIPSDTAEQKAIASILSDADAEIKAMEEKLAKYRQIKQGMMQQLLTGKIRLV